MKKIITLGLIFVINIMSLLAQNDSTLDFWPIHKKDIWQYRSTFDNKIDHTTNIDSIIVDTLTKNTIVFEGGWNSNFYNHYRIDSIGNVYNRGSDSAFVRYKLYADSSDTWVSAFFNEDTVMGKVILVYNSSVFNTNTIVKAYRFETRNFSFGTDHVAKNFGLIGTNGEGVSFYLSGAIVNGIKYGTIVSVNEFPETIPNELTLQQNYPNPFNPVTKIRYEIPKTTEVNLKVINILGEEVAELVNEIQRQGSYETEFNASKLSNGVYIAVLQTKEVRLTRCMLLIK